MAKPTWAISAPAVTLIVSLEPAWLLRACPERAQATPPSQAVTQPDENANPQSCVVSWFSGLMLAALWGPLTQLRQNQLRGCKISSGETTA